MTNNCAGCDTTGGIASCPIHGGAYATKIESYEKVLDLMAQNAKLRGELDEMTKHANEGWGLANRRAAELRDALIEIGELRRLIYRVDDYFMEPEIQGRLLVVPHKLAQDIRSVAQRRKCVCPHHSFKPDMRGCRCCGETVGQQS